MNCKFKCIYEDTCSFEIPCSNCCYKKCENCENEDCEDKDELS